MSPTENSHRYAVRLSRHAEFPLDMLRRDRAAPASEADHALVDLLSLRQNDDALRALPKEVTVALVGAAPPTIARWESFGCAVLDEGGARLASPEALHRAALRREADEERIRASAGDLLARLEGLVAATAPLRGRPDCPGLDAARAVAESLIARLRRPAARPSVRTH